MTDPYPELPRITKRELARVGVKLVLEDSVREWMRRGWLEMELYQWGHSRFERYEKIREKERQRLDPPPQPPIKRIFDEDGA